MVINGNQTELVACFDPQAKGMHAFYCMIYRTTSFEARVDE